MTTYILKIPEDQVLWRTVKENKN